MGQRIAASLDLQYVDRPILQQVARKQHHDVQAADCRAERVQTIWEKVADYFNAAGTPETVYVPPAYLPLSDRDLFHNEIEIMEAVAAERDCLFMGLAAAHVLPMRPGTVNLLLYAPLEFRVQRVQQIYQVATEAQAHTMVMESDTMRRKFVSRMTGREWLYAGHYHLAMDTSLLPLDDITDLLLDYIKRRTSRETDRAMQVRDPAPPNAAPAAAPPEPRVNLAEVSGVVDALPCYN